MDASTAVTAGNIEGRGGRVIGGNLVAGRASLACHWAESRDAQG